MSSHTISTSPRPDCVQLDVPTDATLNRCPACGSRPEVWEARSRCELDAQSHTKVTKYVCCPNTGYGSDDGKTDEGLGTDCPFYEPPGAFHRATKREAIEFWNLVTGRKIPLTDEEQSRG